MIAVLLLIMLFFFSTPLVLTSATIRPEEAAHMTGDCLGQSSLTIVAEAFLSYVFFGWLLERHVVPVICFTRYNSKESEEKRSKWRKKMVSLVLPMTVRVLCFCLLTPVWEFFSLEHGLSLNSTTAEGHCNLGSDGVSAVRSYHISRYLLASLMLYDLGTEAGWIDWSVTAHHVSTLLACVITTDSVFLELLGGQVMTGDVANGIGFVSFYYAALTAIETALVLTYHLQEGQRPMQVAAMGAAALIQLANISVFFLVLPGILIANTHRSGELPTGLVVLILMILLFFFLVELGIVSVRVAIARKKWREHRLAMQDI
jgi:hypothetical protein